MRIDARNAVCCGSRLVFATIHPAATTVHLR
jgi:hypothetical protein